MTILDNPKNKTAIAVYNSLPRTDPNRRFGSVWATTEEVIAATRLAKSTAGDQLRKLLAEGLVERRPQPGRRTASEWRAVELTADAEPEERDDSASEPLVDIATEPAAAVEDLTALSRDALRAMARDLGLTPPQSAAKQKLIDAIREARLAARNIAGWDDLAKAAGEAVRGVPISLDAAPDDVEMITFDVDVDSVNGSLERAGLDQRVTDQDVINAGMTPVHGGLMIADESDEAALNNPPDEPESIGHALRRMDDALAAESDADAPDDEADTDVPAPAPEAADDPLAAVIAGMEAARPVSAPPAPGPAPERTPGRRGRPQGVPSNLDPRWAGGGIKTAVLKYLRKKNLGDASPSEIAKAIQHGNSGAVGNACRRLAESGELTVVQDKPLRYAAS